MIDIKVKHQYVLNNRRVIFSGKVETGKGAPYILSFLSKFRENGQDMVNITSYYEKQYKGKNGRVIEFEGPPLHVESFIDRGTQSESSIRYRDLAQIIIGIKLLAEETV